MSYIRTANTNQLLNVVESNKEAYRQVKSARSLLTTSLFLSYAGGFMIGWPIGTLLGGGQPNWTFAAVGATLIVATIPIGKVFNKKMKRAVDIYNSELHRSSFWDKNDVSFSLTNNGMAMVLSF